MTNTTWTEARAAFRQVADACLAHRESTLETVCDWLAENYFRVTVEGLEHVPLQGPAMLAANHSGAFALDACILRGALVGGVGRPVLFQAAGFVFRLPGIGGYARTWATSDDPTLGYGELAAGRLVALFPEGVPGVAKPFSQRYRLRAFQPGFALTALRSGAPVLPVSIVGAEEAFPKLGEVRLPAGLLDVPYVPVTTALPLPSKWLIRVGEPIQPPPVPKRYADRADAAVRLSEQVRAEVQRMVDADRAKRRTVFW